VTTSDTLIGSDHPLGPHHRICLDRVLDLIVPPSEDGRKPGASEVGVAAFIAAEAPDALPGIREALDDLDARAHARFGTGFASIGAEEQRLLVESMRAADATYLRRLAFLAVACYYQNDTVLASLGLEARAPYPKGYAVASGDLTLLDPVRARGRIYREA